MKNFIFQIVLCIALIITGGISSNKIIISGVTQHTVGKMAFLAGLLALIVTIMRRKQDNKENNDLLLILPIKLSNIFYF
jgi:hypothetical protein